MIKLLEYLSEVIGWIQIAVSPFLIGLGVGVIIYLSAPTSTNLVIGIVIATIGLSTGIIWATKIWKQQGTIRFLSRIMESTAKENSSSIKKTLKV